MDLPEKPDPVAQDSRPSGSSVSGGRCGMSAEGLLTSFLLSFPDEEGDRHGQGWQCHMYLPQLITYCGECVTFIKIASLVFTSEIMRSIQFASAMSIFHFNS